jgi:hypothetical protein
MKKKFERLKSWCNANQGFLAFLTSIFAFIAILPYQKLNLDLTNTIFGKIFSILAYNIQIPFYLIIILLLTILFYIQRMIKKYKNNMVKEKLLYGKWMCEYGIPGDSGSENLLITENNKYIVKNKHQFNVEDISIDPTSNQIRFTKVGINNNRRLNNFLQIKNNELLIGIEKENPMEDGYPIKYTKIQ